MKTSLFIIAVFGLLIDVHLWATRLPQNSVIEIALFFVFIVLALLAFDLTQED